MRKALALLLAVLMVFSMAACGKDDSSLADRANKIGEIKTQADQQKKHRKKSPGNRKETRANGSIPSPVRDWMPMKIPAIIPTREWI